MGGNRKYATSDKTSACFSFDLEEPAFSEVSTCLSFSLEAPTKITVRGLFTIASALLSKFTDGHNTYLKCLGAKSSGWALESKSWRGEGRGTLKSKKQL